MTSPTYCTSCGHELGVGRFCTNCGRPVPGRHPEADPSVGVPTVTAPVVPPPTGELPPAARYPLFADAPPTVVSPAVPAAPPAVAPVPLSPDPGPRQGVRWVPLVVASVLLAMVAGVGGYLLVSRIDDRATDDEAQQSSPSVDATSGGPEETAPEETAPEETEPVETAPEDVVELNENISAEVPAVAPPSRDRENRPVRFRPANMWDGRPRTAWRMPGDGAGQTLTFDLGDEVVLTEVGLINGYAKIDGPNDWYGANRRVRKVQWEFDDGTRVTQDLVDDRDLQLTEIGPVRTRTVLLHLLEVSAPAEGPRGRDFTAISEVRLLGVR